MSGRNGQVGTSGTEPDKQVRAGQAGRDRIEAKMVGHVWAKSAEGLFRAAAHVRVKTFEGV